MLRTMTIVLAATVSVSLAHSQELSSLTWAATTLPKISRSKTPLMLLIQEPYCESGVGDCGGQCSEDGGKRWQCPATALPCYRPGRCTCEEATICKPQKKR